MGLFWGSIAPRCCRLGRRRCSVWLDAGGADLCGTLLGGTRLINKMCESDATTRDGIWKGEQKKNSS